MKEEKEIKNNVVIIVNGEEKEVLKEKISYEEVIKLVYENYEENDSTIYTIIYYKGNSEKPNGYLLKGQEVMVKKGMRINVTRTNKS